LIVGISALLGNSQVSSVTYNGVSLTRLAMSAYQNTNGIVLVQTELWYLLNPSVGTGDVVVTWSGGRRFTAGSSSYFGVSQTTPFGTAYNSSGGMGQGTSITGISSATNDLILDLFARTSDSDSYGIPTPGAGQSQRWYNKTNLSGTTWIGNGIVGGSSSKPSSGSTESMSWSWTGGRDWAELAVPMHST
jgi:hypothetical protein